MSARDGGPPVVRPTMASTVSLVGSRPVDDRGMAASGRDDDAIDPSIVVGLLAEASRLRVFAAGALGAATLAEVGAAAALDTSSTLRALDRLVTGGLVSRSSPRPGRVAGGPRVAAPGATYRVRQERITAAARARAEQAPPVAFEGEETLPDEQREVLRNFMADGRLASVPVARSKRLILLDFLAGRFEPGRVYPEREVNLMLGTVHADYAALRRYLVDEGFLERRGGFYWRAGGTFDIS